MKNLESLILKYFDDSLNQEETEELKKLLEIEENMTRFKEYVHLNHLIHAKSEFNYTSELHEFRVRAKKRFKLKSLFKYAAVILLLISVGYVYLSQDQQQIATPSIENNTIKVGTDKAILTLEDGTNIPLEKGKHYRSTFAESNGENLVYASSVVKDSSIRASITYNYLTIPRGGQYFVKLPDGTGVWLNSESKLKYPTTFIKGDERRVELVYGEAYFDVSPSSEHEGSRFKVHTRFQEVDVIGTEFNIKAFKDENEILTTLVEGVVKISKDELEKELIPNQQSIITSTSSSIKIVPVNVYNEVSWKDGVFSFNNKSLDKMMKILSRWYNVDIHFKNSAQKNLKFTGEVERSSRIESILKDIEKTNEVKFTINDKTIIIE
ncbi:FecR family protein [Flavobacteriaceae bacterium F08102]|nr:FecR family protein [Flavobacteriaceae bacterium F08102]